VLSDAEMTERALQVVAARHGEYESWARHLGVLGLDAETVLPLVAARSIDVADQVHAEDFLAPTFDAVGLFERAMVYGVAYGVLIGLELAAQKSLIVEGS
jgi:hypothetical protein